jgi:hypothetical protein
LREAWQETLIRNPVDHLRITDKGWEKAAAPDRIINGPSAPVTRSAIGHSSSGFRITRSPLANTLRRCVELSLELQITL